MPFQNQILAGAAGAGGAGLELYAWGSQSGKFHGDTISRCVPTQVGTDKVWDGDPNITDRKINALQGGYNLIREDGSLWWTGDNTYGGSGLGNTTNFDEPQQVGSLKDWEFVRGGRTAHAIKTDGTLWAFGYGGAGQLGDGTTISKSSPVQIGTETDWTHCGSGNNSAIGIRDSGKLFTWGHWETNGQSASKISYSSPVQIGTATNWTDCHTAPDNAYAIAGGALYATGAGGSGANGQGNTTAQLTFVQIGTLTNWSKLCGSQSHNSGCLAIKTDGTLWGWGNNAGGTLMQSSGGAGGAYSSPIQLGDSTDWMDVDYGAQFCIGIRDANDDGEGTLWTWGLNYYGAQGNGNTISSSSPTQVASDTDWKGCTSGNDHVNAVK